MSESKREIEITRSRSQIPCLWEKGGGWSNTGEAQIIADRQGNPKRAIHIRTHGDLSCRDHALIPVKKGDHVITVFRHRDRVSTQVERIVSIKGDTATLVPEIEPICDETIRAAVDKCNDYHCRTPYYIRED